jgi:hypothetical protein
MRSAQVADGEPRSHLMADPPFRQSMPMTLAFGGFGADRGPVLEHVTAPRACGGS